MDITPEEFGVTGGLAKLDRFGILRFTAHGVERSIYVGRYDLAELLRKACGSDAEALTALASVMTNGHRFTVETYVGPTIQDILVEEPF